MSLTIPAHKDIMVSNDTKRKRLIMAAERSRIETREEIRDYLSKLKYALKNGARITFQQDRAVDQERNIRYTNRFTVNSLFPDENPVDALRRELETLSVEEYIRTVKDIRFPKRSEMREFGRVYNGADEVYIKIRVELLSANGTHTLFVMSFHYAISHFTEDLFPYKAQKRR